GLSARAPRLRAAPVARRRDDVKGRGEDGRGQAHLERFQERPKGTSPGPPRPGRARRPRKAEAELRPARGEQFLRVGRGQHKDYLSVGGSLRPSATGQTGRPGPFRSASSGPATGGTAAGAPASRSPSAPAAGSHGTSGSPAPTPGRTPPPAAAPRPRS